MVPPDPLTASPADAALYRGVSRTLTGGLIASFALMGLGLLGLLLDPAAGTGADQVVPLDRLPAALLRLDPAALLDLGVLTLLFIPVVHLAVSGVVFLRAGERRYALAAGLVLLLLALSAALALGRR
jgi:uncharacterized membrane protein